MLNDEIKSRILMEMNKFIGCDALQKLKMCLDRNFYITYVKNTRDFSHGMNRHTYVKQKYAVIY